MEKCPLSNFEHLKQFGERIVGESKRSILGKGDGAVWPCVIQFFSETRQATKNGKLSPNEIDFLRVQLFPDVVFLGLLSRISRFIRNR